MTLGPDWTTGPDGLRFRKAARVLVLNPDGRALLVRGHDVDQPERSWWFTVGGGIDAGETAREAAARELREETGLSVDEASLVGPVGTRSGLFHFYAETCRQDETFFAYYSPTPVVPSRAGWTSMEQDLLDDLTWMSAEQLRAQPREYFPLELPAMIERLAGGWDGSVLELGLQDDDASERNAGSTPPAH